MLIELIIIIGLILAFGLMKAMLNYLDGNGFVTGWFGPRPTPAMREDCDNGIHSFPKWGKPNCFGTQERRCVCCNLIQRSDDRHRWDTVPKGKSKNGQ